MSNVLPRSRRELEEATRSDEKPGIERLKNTRYWKKKRAPCVLKVKKRQIDRSSFKGRLKHSEGE